MTEPLTELEIYLHATLEDVKQLILAGGVGSETPAMTAIRMIDIAHQKYMKKLSDYVEDNIAPTGPGGLHHGE